jgi:succinoglycan biosynthesis transport protein ExoP
MMKPSDILRLIKKHILLLILIPAILGTAAAFMTTEMYSSKTTLYTGMTSGTNVQIDQSFNLFTTNAAFDNLINIIQSRETSQEVAVRLLAQHLMLKKADPRYISKDAYTELKLRVPADVNRLVVWHAGKEVKPSATDTSFSFTGFADINTLKLQPPFINREAYEQTVTNLTNYLLRDDTNFIYRLVNSGDAHYSIKSISSVSVRRITTSDLIELKFESNDPGICQQTLVLLTEVCMKNYRSTKETRTDAVAKYFEYKTKQAYDRLTAAEDRQMQYNQDHNIINYADQSRAVAGARANYTVELQNKRIKLAGIEATVEQLQEKLSAQQKTQLSSTNLLEKRNQLADINTRIATAETSSSSDNDQDIENLKLQAKQLNDEISEAVTDLYNSSSSVQGMTGGTLMNTYLANVKEMQETRASISMLENRIRESQAEYSSYEPAGVDLKRIEREISIAEREYMEFLKGLNLAKLKEQDVALSSNIKAVDPPYFPLFPNAGKRMMLIGAAAFFGLLLVIFAILIMEYFDATLRNPQKASKILGLQPAGVYPRINGNSKQGFLPIVTNRLIEMIIQQVELHPLGKPFHSSPRTVLFFSTLSSEGKTLLLGNVANKLKQQGKKVITINFSGDSILESEISRLDKEDDNRRKVQEPGLLKRGNEPVTIDLLEKYQDITEESEDVSLEVPETERSSEGHLVLRVDQSYYSINNYLDVLDRNPFSTSIVPDYVLIELPPLLHHSYPAGLVASSDVAVMVCRSNRSWSDADQGALDTFMKLTPNHPLFVLNGVENQVVKSAIGELPKKSKGIRKKMRKMAQAS